MTERIKNTILNELEDLKSQGRSKSSERVIIGYKKANENSGPRFMLKDQEKEFIRMNSNSYLGLSQHEKLISAEKDASEKLGVNPGGVRFIDGTTKYHVILEEKLAEFHNKEASKIFSSAYMANLGVALSLINKNTFVISDSLNHNSIIRSLRIAGLPRENKGIYSHNNIEELKETLQNIPEKIERVIIFIDGIFSMRGDYASLKEITALAREFNDNFKDGVLVIVDDSHGVAAYGETGRGTTEITMENGVDIITGTLGKGFGAEGGYVASTKEIIELIRQRADTYIYTNPISPGAANAGISAVELVNSEEGQKLLSKLKKNSEYFREKIEELGFETIEGIHPIIPVMVRDTQEVNKIVDKFLENGVLVTGIVFPVVPKGEECIRIQISAAHTLTDLDYVLDLFKEVKK